MGYGYACINTSLQKLGISTNRTLRAATLRDKGLDFYGKLIEQNIDDLFTILKWNDEHRIKFFRISSDLFTHRDKISIYDLPNYSSISNKLKNIGEFILANGHRVSFHADHYTILASQRQEVVNKSIADLEFLGKIFDMMGLPLSSQYKINLHIGTFKPTKEEAIERFYNSLYRLSPSVIKRLTVENDDSPNGFSVSDLHKMLYTDRFRLPIVFDYLHHSLNTGGLSEQEALQLAASTWPEGIKPVVHYSSSKKLNEDSKATKIAHADYIYEKIQSYGLDLDIMFEAKAKESALLRYLV